MVVADHPTVLIRDLVRGDDRALSFMFGRLGEDARYQRFLVAKRELTPADLRLLMNVDHWHREAVIAWSPPPRAPIGVARYARTSQFDLAEVAVTVVDAWQRRGIGGELVDVLRERAVGAGIHRFTATLLWSNRGALALLRRWGPTTVMFKSGGVAEVYGRWA